MYLLVICISLEKCVFKLPIFNWVVYFVIVKLQSYLCTVHIIPLPDILFASILFCKILIL